LQKNWILKKRSRLQTLAEVGYPLYFLTILIVLHRTLGGPTVTYIPEKTSPIWSLRCTDIYPSCPTCIDIIYAPNTTTVTQVVDRMQRETFSPLRVQGFSREDELEEYYRNNPESTLAGIIFHSMKPSEPSSNSSISHLLEYSYDIRMNVTLVDAIANATRYLYSGYLGIQQQLLQALIHLNLPKERPTVKLQFTTASFPATVILNWFQYVMASYFPLIFGYSLQQAVVLLVTEKQKKLKIVMTMMGMKTGAYWLSWAITQTVINFFAIVIFEIVGFSVGFFQGNDPVILTLVFLEYSFCLLTLGFLISAFVSQPRIGTIFAWLIQMFLVGVMILAHFFVLNDPNVNAVWKVLISLVCSVPLGEVIFIIGNIVITKNGVSFANSWQYSLMLFVDILLYGALAWYFSQVQAEEYGISKPLHFLCTPSYWRGITKKQKRQQFPKLINEDNERLLGEVEWSIVLENLRKEFRKGAGCRKSSADDATVAVHNISLKIRKGEIFALLGHNGAGKTTTLNILTGLMPATSGKAYINGYDVNVYMEELQQDMGVCLQQDTLFDLMTVREHLILFARLKGVPDESIPSLVDEKLKEIDLDRHQHKLASELSGGMKRKLSVLIAFIGNPRILFLDECTAGMDPYSRRKVWLLLQRYKRYSTIIMTTHFMEEAELLGERIAIMSKGKLRCCGTSLELKNEFGIGYQLTFVRSDNDVPVEEIRQRVEQFLRLHLGQERFNRIKFLRSSEVELKYQIPHDMRGDFPYLFRGIEGVKEKLGVRSYALQMTTLEEVFLKIADDEENEREELLIN
jgi:ATP-binding cassette subfamily A (ABC1) protein 5